MLRSLLLYGALVLWVMPTNQQTSDIDVQIDADTLLDNTESSASATGETVPSPSVSRLLGVSYDLLRGHPFSMHADPGLGTTTSTKLLQLRFSRNPLCPLHADCVNLDNRQGQAMHVNRPKAAAKTFSDYQRIIKSSLHLSASTQLGDITSGIGILTPELDTLRTHLTEGLFFVDYVNVSVLEEASLKRYSIKQLSLSDELASSLCDLPEEYEHYTYRTFIQRFGTHMVTKVQRVKLSRRRVFIDINAVFEQLVRSGTVFAGNGNPLSERLVLSRVENAVLYRAAEKILKNRTTDLVVSETIDQAPFVTELWEIPQLIKLKQSSTTENCREEWTINNSTQANRIASISANLYRAIRDYSNDSQSERFDQPVDSIPWPADIRNQIRALRGRQLLASQVDSCETTTGHLPVLGLGYDILRADPLGEDFHGGIHLGDPILHPKLCVTNCTETVRCINLPSTGVRPDEHVIRSPEDYQNAIISSVDFRDAVQPALLASVGILSSTLRNLKQLLAQGSTVTDTTQQSDIQELKLMSNDALILDARFLSAACSLPDDYDSAEYTSFLKQYGTHVIVQVKYGNFSLNRTVHREGSTSLDMVTTEQSIRPVKLVVKNISSFFAPSMIAQSLPPPECQKLANVTRLKRFKQFLDAAIVDYAETPRMVLRPSTTTASTTSTTTAAITTTFSTTTSHPFMLLPRGIAKGVIRDAYTMEYLPGVTVTAQLPSGNFRSASRQSDTAGQFAVALPALSGYDFHFELPGYYSAVLHNIQITSNQERILEPLLYINKQYSGIGTASGNISNAQTGFPEPEVSLHFRSGINVFDGDIVATRMTISSRALWSVELPTGHYTVTASKRGFITTAFTVVVLGGEDRGNQNHVIAPLVSNQEIRFVLRWGETPLDLDLHLRGPIDDNRNRMHVYWNAKLSPDNYTNLDVDDQISYGPETITIVRQLPGMYRVSVHDYTNRNASISRVLEDSGAEVVMYRGNRQVEQYFVPTGGGTLWDVLEISGSEIKVLNSMSYKTRAEECG